MDRAALNKIRKMHAIDPAAVLRKLRKVEIPIAMSNHDSRVKALRTNYLKRDRENREACLFCYGMSVRLGHPIWFYPFEDSDFDFVAAWDEGDCRHYAPTQLKEVVPEELNSRASLQAVLDGIGAKYKTSNGLTVAIHLNQTGHFDPKNIVLPDLKIAGLWIFGAISEDQSQWFVCGDVLTGPTITIFDYPL